MKNTAISARAQALERLLRNRIAMVSLAFLVVVGGLCFGAPLFSSYAWDALDFTFEALPPSREHWFGVDEMGRDLFARVLYGGRVSLSVGLITTAVSTLVGVSFGAIAGYFGGWFDALMMRFVDLMYALPSYFLILLVMVFFEVESIYVLFLVLALFQWLGMARIVRAQVLSLREREYVVAVRSCGAGHARVIFRHLIPNTLGVVAVYATMTVPGVMLQEAFLSFIGISFQAMGSDGVMKPVASWGSLVSEGAKVFETAPWLLAFPAAFFSLTLLAINFVGDGLRDALDPNMKV
ncbi:MAG: ABC transporter permease [Silvanigrellales bacterium]|nr:ABC transporter permease [Silvanigrellales bacterium]